jgi:predicted DNA-binding protein
MLRIRLTTEQKHRLEQLAKADGEVTLSSYCRKKLFEDLSTEIKLNKILQELKIIKNGLKK